MSAPPRLTPLRTIYGYALGEGAVSLSMNGIANFAMLFYTQVLGLGPKYAGLALSVTLIWDAISDPVMGHITDNTRSRFGRRHPYMMAGGLLLAVSFFFLWFVPDAFSGPERLFWYLLLLNLIVRTTVTVFMVPYTALGFEICTDYDERSKLQSARFFLNQVVNFAGGALAWSIFFRDRVAEDGSRVDGTRIAGNYLNMGIVLTIATALFIISCVYFTRRYARDNRDSLVPHNDLRAFIKDFKETALDRYGIYVFGFFAVAQLGMMLVAQVQMFTYVDFMQFTHGQKTVAHGAGMLAFALGALFQAWLVVRIDKKATAMVGILISVLGSIMLLILFIGGILPPQTVWPVFGGLDLPVSVLAFALFQGMWWGGMGMLLPLFTSMVADVSEVNYVRTGSLRDGSYGAMFSFFLKAAAGVGMFLNGWFLELAGYQSGAEHQAPEAIRNVAIITFVSGPIVILLALPILIKYPIDRAFMQEIKRRKVEIEQVTTART